MSNDNTTRIARAKICAVSHFYLMFRKLAGGSLKDFRYAEVDHSFRDSNEVIHIHIEMPGIPGVEKFISATIILKEEDGVWQVHGHNSSIDFGTWCISFSHHDEDDELDVYEIIKIDLETKERRPITIKVEMKEVET